MLKKAIIGFISTAFLVAGALVALILHNGFPYRYMDLNDSGFVSPREALQALDLGIRDADVDGKNCVEVFALKDAQTVKQFCFEP